MIDQFESRLKDYVPWTLSQSIAPEREAGVIMLLTDQPEPQVILTERAQKLSSHAGEVAFPGGKRDPEDVSVLNTALREAQEEIGINPEDVRILGSLSQILSLHNLSVTPFVGIVPDQIALRPNPHEIQSIFKAPLSYLMDKDNLRMNDFVTRTGRTRYVPSWRYQEYEIWGLTAWVIAEFLNLCLDARIPTRPRPERQNESA